MRYIKLLVLGVLVTYIGFIGTSYLLDYTRKIESEKVREAVLPDFATSPENYSNVTSSQLKKWQPYCSPELEEKNKCLISDYFHYFYREDPGAISPFNSKWFTVVNPDSHKGLTCSLASGSAGFQVVEATLGRLETIKSINKEGCHKQNYPDFVPVNSVDLVLYPPLS